jgi:ribosomal protein L37AE/L43A
MTEAGKRRSKGVFSNASCKGILGKNAVYEKSGPQDPQPQRPSKFSCPECESQRLYRNGLRYLADGETVQRWLCRDCGFRFGEPSKTLKTVSDNRENRQVCVIEAKNLSSAAETKTVAGGPQSKEAKGLIIQFMAWLDKEGYTKGSRYPNNLTTLVNLGADLLNPESVKIVLGKHDTKNGAKLQYVYAYSAFAKMLKIKWEPPKYKQEETLPFIPDEKELDQLIAACRSKRMAAYLQCLKETFADPGEALKLRWIDISSNIIPLNKPVKGHLPRQLEVSNKLLSMLNSLPKTSERIFPTTYNVMFCCFNRVRKRAAELQKNPSYFQSS